MGGSSAVVLWPGTPSYGSPARDMTSSLGGWGVGISPPFGVPETTSLHSILPPCRRAPPLSGSLLPSGVRDPGSRCSARNGREQLTVPAGPAGSCRTGVVPGSWRSSPRSHTCPAHRAGLPSLRQHKAPAPPDRGEASMSKWPEPTGEDGVLAAGLRRPCRPQRDEPVSEREEPALQLA